MKSCVFSLVLVSGVTGMAQNKDVPQGPNAPMAQVDDKHPGPFGDGKGNLQREKIADDIAAQVSRDSRANYRISGLFENYEKEDKSELKVVKGDKNMVALIQEGSRVEPAKEVKKMKAQVPIDAVQQQIEAQRNLIVDIHSPFEAKEKEDIHDFEKVKKDPRLQAMLLQTGRHGLKTIKKHWYDSDTDSSTTTTDSSAADDIFRSGYPSRVSSLSSEDSTLSTTSYNADATSNSGVTSTDSGSDAGGVKTFDWSKLTDEISESAKETAKDDSDLSSSTTSNMDDMNKYIAKFSLDKPADVPKQMNPTDFSQDFHHSSNYGGSVISIPLSSQLQVSASTSFLQQRAASTSKIAPGVEEEVAKEKKWDVYLADGFKTQEEKDVQDVKRMKGRKEYSE